MLFEYKNDRKFRILSKTYFKIKTRDVVRHIKILDQVPFQLACSGDDGHFLDQESALYLLTLKKLACGCF